MDIYRENFRKAQKEADSVILLKKGNYLNEISSEDICTGDGAYTSRITHWFTMSGCRKINDYDRRDESNQLAISKWLRMTSTNGGTIAFALKRDNGKLSVLYGSELENHEIPLITHIPECELQPTSITASGYSYNGVITGTILSKGLADNFASSKTDNAYISCIVFPVTSQEMQRKIEENRSEIEYLNTYKSFQRTYGNASRKIEEVPIQKVVQAIELLREENDYIEHNMGAGFARTAVKFGANTYEDYRCLKSLIYSSMDYDRDIQSAAEPVRTFTLQNVCRSWTECLEIPFVHIFMENENRRVYMLTLQDIRSITSFCLPPLSSYDGFYVKDYDIGEDEMEAFPLTQPVSQNGVELGSVLNSSSRAGIPLSALHAHAFVTGATETGKTTTVKKILSELYSKGIPFTVIEAAKKEYISLIGNIPELRVYTPGNDGFMLRFNPLQPEDGILIENHVAAVVRALIAATGGEHPIPEAYDGLLKQTYQKYGWEYGTMAYTDEHKPFPTFKDVLENVDSYIAMHAKYGPEVKQNLTAALKLRSENMHSGALGNLFSKAAGLQAADILLTPCVIELADFSPQSAAFIMNIILFKLHSYLSRQPESSELKRVIVVEEAHNIFRRTLVEENGRAINNEYFEKMLAEIRSSGTGLILSDQRPSIMSEAVMANTSVKIVHALTASEDRTMVGETINLSSFQIKKLAELKVGECVIALRGYHGVQHVQVERTKENDEFHAACHVCRSRFRCRRDAVKNMIANMNSNSVSFHVSKIQSNPYNISLLEANITNMLRDLNVTATDTTKICLLGEILDRFGSSSFQEKRIIVTSYARYLRGGKDE